MIRRFLHHSGGRVTEEGKKTQGSIAPLHPHYLSSPRVQQSWVRIAFVDHGAAGYFDMEDGFAAESA
ncbi:MULTISPECIES: hypothetical protein [Novosphingobium]|jgi:hypothetical protein|uniref:hypothetical protein n=1 Tax=Novosphingobium TaxID=165696 RepID=UPI0022F264B9|nr:hypothetical protein [Novosphingobium resinovorum]